MIHKRTYLDFNASTPTSVEVRQAISEYLATEGTDGNPSSIHWAGRMPKLWIRESRQKLAAALGAQALELIFTSGGTESNNTVIRGCFERSLQESRLRNEFITSTVEHPSVQKTFRYLESRGAIVHYIPVNRHGIFDFEQFDKVLSDRTFLVSLMAANNETGTIFPLREVVVRAHEVGALVHSDMVQALGKMPIDLHQLGVDYASFSGHKFYALKGVGLLYSRKGSPLLPLLTGGAQERNRRGGTENTLGILALGKMAERLSEVRDQAARLENLRDKLEQQIRSRIQHVSITAHSSPRLANTSSLVLRGVDGETLLMSLDLLGYAVSTGAACSSGNPEPSPVLLAMGLSRGEAQNSLRISLGWTTTEDEVDGFVAALVEVVERLRSLHQGEVER